MSSRAISNDVSQETLQQRAVATHTVIEHHLGLVVHIAKRYAGSYQGHRILDLDDLVQEGVLGLMHAAEKFDARKRLSIQYLCHLLDTLGHWTGDHERVPHNSSTITHLVCSATPGACTSSPLAAKAKRAIPGRTG